MRKVRRSAAADGKAVLSRPQISPQEGRGGNVHRRRDRSPEPSPHGGASGRRGSANGDLRRRAWQWALANQAGDGSLPSGREIAVQYGRHERWGRLVKRSGAAGEFAADGELGEPGLRLIGRQMPSATGG
jgi:hypothetical protein